MPETVLTFDYRDYKSDIIRRSAKVQSFRQTSARGWIMEGIESYVLLAFAVKDIHDAVVTHGDGQFNGGFLTPKEELADLERFAGFEVLQMDGARPLWVVLHKEQP